MRDVRHCGLRRQRSLDLLNAHCTSSFEIDFFRVADKDDWIIIDDLIKLRKRPVKDAFIQHFMS